jgi:hypothetical protein
MTMLIVSRKYVATLLLAVISAYFGHVLGEDVAGTGNVIVCQMVFTANDTNDNEHGDFGSHHHEHGMSCDVWLCSGFSGVILGTEAVIPLSANIDAIPFAVSKNKGFPSRTIEPLLDPPKS